MVTMHGREKAIPYTLIRSRRKTAAIYIQKDASVEVRAPLNADKKQIDDFVLSKQEWIQKHLVRQKEVLLKRQTFSLCYGDYISIKGKKYPIVAREGNHAGLDEAGLFMPPNLPPDEIKEIISRVLRLTAKNILTEKTATYAKCMDLVPDSVKVNGAKKRWGSCSGKNKINYSWRLVLAEDDVIDYVVVHELAHIQEHNHSPRFWDVVENTLPDYKVRRKKLRQLQARLEVEGWM